MSNLTIDYWFTRYIVNPAAAADKKCISAVGEPLHAGNVSRLVKVGGNGHSPFPPYLSDKVFFHACSHLDMIINDSADIK